MIDMNTLSIVLGIAGLEGIRMFVRHVYKKTEREDLVVKNDLEAFRRMCDQRKAECLTCLSAIKERQLELRSDLPKDYVQKGDFTIAMTDLKSWMNEISSKVDRIIEHRNEIR